MKAKANLLRTLTVLAAAALAALALGDGRAQAQLQPVTVDHRTVTVGPQSREAAWNGPPGPAANASYDAEDGGPCGETPADFCDTTLLRVDARPSDWGGKPGGVLVTLTPDANSPDNFDLYIYQSDASGKRGDLIARSDHSNAATDVKGELTGILKPSGYYLIQAVYAEVAGSKYTGKATFIPPSEWTPKHGAEALGLACEATKEAENGVPYADCVGLVEGFDGMTLSSKLKVPEAASGPLPTLMYLHSWGGNRSQWDLLDDSTRVEYSPHFGPKWFVSQGYAAFSYSARGNAGSCGYAFTGTTGGNNTTDAPPRGPEGEPGPAGDNADKCAEGYTHLAEHDYETKDSQHLLGVLVDYGIADPDRLAAAGDSMGGGQTWQLATSPPWQTPSGSRTLQLAAAIPRFSWTDLQNSLVPNGRAGDQRDQGASHETPYGIPKESFTSTLLAGRASVGGVARYNDQYPDELHSYLDGWFGFWQQGESYDADSPKPGLTFTGAQLAEAFRNKSAYYADAQAVPIFAVSGWTDTPFPAGETLQMYRKLKAAKPDYPIYMAFGDIGHYAQWPKAELRYFDDQANKFLNKFLKTSLPEVGSGGPDANIFSFETKCPASEALQPEVSATDWDGMRAGDIELKAEGSRNTTSGPPNMHEEAATTPEVAGSTDSRLRGAFLTGIKDQTGIELQDINSCITQAPGTYDDQADWTWDVPQGGFTLLGLPTVKVNYVLDGDDATIAAKLWDVAPDGTRTLVTRGMYRLSVAGGDKNGTVERPAKISFQLFGNHYKLEQGHQATLELSQTDAPFLRPDSLPSSIQFSAPKLTLPTVEEIP